MLTSPRVTGEWRNAVCDRLAPGEELVALSDILSFSWYSDGWGEHLGDVGCGFMAVTNINLRFGQWKEQVTKTGFLKREFAFLPEVQNMVTWNHGSVTSLSHTEHGVREHRFGAELQWKLGALDPSVYGGSTPDFNSMANMNFTWVNLQLSNRAGPEDDGFFFAPFKEFREVVSNFEALKAGTFLAANASSAANALDRLRPLLQDGIITQEEFDRAKDGFLGSPVETQSSAVDSLRQLHSLHNSGILTESEFNMKKWDILSKPT